MIHKKNNNIRLIFALKTQLLLVYWYGHHHRLSPNRPPRNEKTRNTHTNDIKTTKLCLSVRSPEIAICMKISQNVDFNL